MINASSKKSNKISTTTTIEGDYIEEIVDTFEDEMISIANGG